jgi:beta-lactamase regulating signal transducer with metallopeptidase domain/tetratricopeptide (TPR) repeat protein
MSTLVLDLLADASVRTLALALLVAAILSGFRVRSSVMRHAAWTAVLCAMLLMPALTYVVPAFPVPVSLRYASVHAVDRVRAAFRGIEHESDQRTVPPTAESNDRPGRPGSGRLPSNSTTSEFSSAPASPPLVEPRRHPVRPDALLVVYAFGSAILSLRCRVGWRRAARLVRAARGIHLTGDCAVPTKPRIRIAESAAILTPVTIGVSAPAIVLPISWRAWPEATLRAVLAHEVAHVVRRDALVSLLAQLNRCLFWFHPLAWWLPGVLTRHAEEACDAVAIGATANAREYARILIDITRVVGHGGGRVSSHAVGIGGGSLLNRRIDRILRGDIHTRLSAARKVLVASACAAAVVLAAGCRSQSTSRVEDIDNAIAQRDHKIRHDLRRVWNETGSDLGRIDWETGAARIEDLEKDLKHDPDNLDTLRALLLAYWIQPDALKRRAHILRLIELHPASALAGSIEARLFLTDRRRGGPFAGQQAPLISLAGDPDGYAQAKRLWLSHASRPNVAPAILGNAAAFFESSEKPLAEQMLMRARTLDPEGPWRARLGQFYATVLVGAEMRSAKNIVRTVTVGEPRSGYGLGVRRMLGQSTDDVLLTAAGWFLARSTRDPWRGFEPVAWAESCFTRALQVNPHAVLAHAELLKLRQQRNRGEALWNAPPALQYETAAALPEVERFERLPHLARTAISVLADLARWDDPNLADRRELARQQARRYAEDALRLAPKFRSHPAVGVAVYTANMTLGELALQDGDTKAAVGFLRKASQAPQSEELAYADHLVSDRHWHLASDLLEAGERPAVMLFLEQMAAINLAHRTELREAAAAVRRGEKPRL